MSDVSITNVLYRYGSVTAVDNVSLAIREGEFFALLGSSGSGKTTILRLVAGFIAPQQGTIAIGGVEMQHLPAYRRNIGFVFQNYALFPHLNVAQNVAFGLESQRAPRPEIEKRVAEALAMVQLTGLERRRPSQLSGGQQQRVALARALVTRPLVLLLDEPLAALDRKLRTEMQVELRQLQRRLGITTVFVTHDQEEALTLSDRVAVLQAGRVEQIGTPLDVYEHPQTRFVADFLGQSNVFAGEVVAQNGRFTTLTTPTGDRILACADKAYAQGQHAHAVVRPEKMRLAIEPPTGDELNVLPATITHIVYAGASLTYHLSTSSNPKVAVFEQNGMRESPLMTGEQVFIAWPCEQTLLLD
jgi:spermidine/putrescine ABC transporter ATP-binding subunit